MHMTRKYSDGEFQSSKSRDPLKLECEHCRETFFKKKHEIQKYLALMRDGITPRNQLKYCSKECSVIKQRTGCYVECKRCNKPHYRQLSHIVKNNFCSNSCSAQYNNEHRTGGFNRSKVEIWIEDQIKTLFPSIEVEFNSRKIIGLELDLFFPTLKVAIELNGIIHYKPIFGEVKLRGIKMKDERKIKLCSDLGITLHVIDISHQSKFTIESSDVFLGSIKNILKEKMGDIRELNPR